MFSVSVAVVLAASVLPGGGQETTTRVVASELTPATFALSPGADLKAALAASPRPALRLTVERLAAANNAGAAASVRVFLNTTAADRSTPIESSGYVGAAVFGHEPASEADALFDPARALARLADQKKLSPDKPLTVTLVVVAPKGSGATVTFRSIALTPVRPRPPA